jgi:hypothetical protein
MVIGEPVGLIRMNAAEYVVENGPVSAAHLEGLALATVHIVSAAHLCSSSRKPFERDRPARLDLFESGSND